jgi:hypothetical protein
MGVFQKAKLAETREAFVATRARHNKYRADELREFESYVLSDHCVNDIERLEAGDYFLDHPQYRLIPKNFQDRKRAIYMFVGTDGILLKLLFFAMRDAERYYSDRLFSFRSDKTATDLLDEISSRSDLGDLYVLKTDVSNYVGSIVPELLIPMIEEIFLPEDPQFCSFLVWIVSRNKVIDVHGELIDHCPGGLGGTPVGNYFMNLYLHGMDDYFAPRAAFYSRYSDDILICSETYEEIIEFEKKFYEFLDELRLYTNMEKTEITMPGEPFDLLGMELCNGEMSISAHSKSKIKRKLRKFTDSALKKRNREQMTPDEAAQMLIRRFNRFFFGAPGNHKMLSWAKWAFPVITNTSSLKEIDHYFQNSLRYVLYGSMKKRNRSIPYEKLSELGYRSLLYYYHHQDKIKDITMN